MSVIIKLCSREVEKEMLVYNSSSTITEDYHSERIVLIVNQEEIKDKQDCAKRIIKKYRENGFKNMRFSHDLSKPNELDVTVCLDKKEADKKEWEFQFRYVQGERDEQYNIIDHPEKFRIEILTDD